MRLPVGPAADFSSLLHINHFVFATKNQRLIFIRNRKLNVLFKIEEKKENLSENYGLDMNRDLGKEIEDMCNFSDLIEERAIEQGIEQGRDRLGALVGRLIDAGRLDDAKRVSEDAAYREALLVEFGL